MGSVCCSVVGKELSYGMDLIAPAWKVSCSDASI